MALEMMAGQKADHIVCLSLDGYFGAGLGLSCGKRVSNHCPEVTQRDCQGSTKVSTTKLPRGRPASGQQSKSGHHFLPTLLPAKLS